MVSIVNGPGSYEEQIVFVIRRHLRLTSAFELDEPEVLWMVGLVGAQFAGCVGYIPGPRTTELKYLATMDGFRGQGLGHALVAKVAASAGPKGVWLQPMDGAGSYYEQKLGFKAFGRRCTWT